MARALSFVLLLLSLAACTMGYGDRLDPAVAQSLKVQQVSVTVASNATFWWGDGERSYARSIGRPEQESDALGATPEGRAFMQNLASQRIKEAFDRELAGHSNGTRPVRVEVVMHDINVASAIQRILIGGNYSMKASANLVDARTGQVIASNPNLSTAVGAGQGVIGAALDPAFGEPIDRLAGNLATSYRNWLVAS